jgi:flagellar hook-length control protein FliK
MNSTMPKLKMSEINFQSSEVIKSKSATSAKESVPSHTGFKELMAKRHHDPVTKQNVPSKTAKSLVSTNAGKNNQTSIDTTSNNQAVIDSKQINYVFKDNPENTPLDASEVIQVPLEETATPILKPAINENTGENTDSSASDPTTQSNPHFVGQKVQANFANILEQTQTDDSKILGVVEPNDLSLGTGVGLMTRTDHIDRSYLSHQPVAAEFQSSAHEIYMPTRFGQEAWAQAMGQSLSWLATQTEQSAIVTLNPPEMGPLKIMLKIKNNVAHAVFSSLNPEVRNALASQQASLKESFNRINIALEQVTINDGQPADHPIENLEKSVNLVNFYA